MANNISRDTRLTDALRKVDDDVSKFAPPAVRDVRNKIEPAPDMLSVSDSTTERIMAAVEEAEKKVTALREQAEKGIATMKKWTTEFENQRAALLESCNTLASQINECVETIVQIGKSPSNGGQ
jgi:predicted  nucleic acid-binding Zn-ribbon protein